jgi:hypothetical protein
LLRVRLQTESDHPVRNKPLDEVKNQQNEKYIASKGEMDLKVPNHKQANRNVAVLNGEVRELKACEEDKPKKVEGGHRCLLQLSNTLVNSHEVFSNGSGVPKTHNCRGQEERIRSQYAQCKKRQSFQPRQVMPDQPDRGGVACVKHDGSNGRDSSRLDGVPI